VGASHKRPSIKHFYVQKHIGRQVWTETKTKDLRPCTIYQLICFPTVILLDATTHHGMSTGRGASRRFI